MNRFFFLDVRQQSHLPEISALNRLLNNPDFQTYLAVLERSLDTTRQRGDYLTGDERGWNQGACQCMQEILDAAKEVREIIRSR